jgi:membrane-associated HD superfamily phosphohydrolase
MTYKSESINLSELILNSFKGSKDMKWAQGVDPTLLNFRLWPNQVYDTSEEEQKEFELWQKDREKYLKETRLVAQHKKELFSLKMVILKNLRIYLQRFF